MEKILMENNGMTVYQENGLKRPGSFDLRKNSSGNADSGAGIRLFEKVKALFNGAKNVSANKVKREPRFPLENIALAIVSIIVAQDGPDHSAFNE